MNRLNVWLGISYLLILACCSQKQESAFAKEETKLIMEGDSLSPMRVLLTTIPDDLLVLRMPSTDVVVNPQDSVLSRLINRLYATVQDSLTAGVGIAAPQVGVLKNIIWVQRFDKEGTPFEVYLNSRIRQYSELKQDCREGCLSIPERVDTTKHRAYAILLAYSKPDGSQHTELVEGFTSVIFQHEIDHLNGVLYVDYLD